MWTLRTMFQSINTALETPKKNTKFLKPGKEQEDYAKYKHDWLLVDAAVYLVFWIAGVTQHIGGTYVHLLLVMAVGTLAFAMPYSYRQFNIRHHA